MAEQIAVSGAEHILNTVISKAVYEIGLAWGVKGEVKKLERVLKKIREVLQDAEKRQVEDVDVRLWLTDLKEVTYDADDILNEIEFESARRMIEIGNRFKNKVRNFFSISNPMIFRFKMAHRVKDLNERLIEIEKEKERFKFNVSSVSPAPVIPGSSVYRETASSVVLSDIVGRKDDKSRLVEKILSEGDVFSVIPVVGLGGLGKTTLAQLVYNDAEVQSKFDPKMWVCVSNNFDVKRVLREMIESISRNKFEVSSMDVMQTSLGDKLNQKKFLLVLDDMWNETQFQEKWDDLSSFLKCANDGSKIVVTTRSRDVASIVGPLQAYDLQTLPSSDCYDIFEKRAFRVGGPERTSKLEAIGREIAKKCAGVPLALKTLGGLMCSKCDEKEWLEIQNSSIWNITDANSRIISVLKLSYDNLSSPLKRCFVYCSIFSKGYRIGKKLLIQLWMAEGFLGLSSGSKMEDLGSEYFDSLCSNSLFQDVEKNKFGVIKGCKIHDLVHDLAVSISGVERSTVDSYDISRDVSKIHWMIYDFYGTKVPEALYKANKLRTFYVCNSFNVENNGFTTMLPNFESLRVLDLSFAVLSRLPLSIGKLKHLRFLDVSETEIEELPKSVGGLYNLQTLRLKACKNLKALPLDLRKLINLRHLKTDLPGSWSEFPRGIGKLTNLQSLPVFKVGGNDDGCSVSELEHLNLLRGKLKFYYLENLRNEAYAKMANLQNKKGIYSLGLEWDRSEQDDTTGYNIIDESVLEAFQPHSNLKELWMRGFCGAKFPRWIVSGSTLCCLLEIYFYKCDKCEYLPSFGQLPLLKKINIDEMKNVKRFGGAWNDWPGNARVEDVGVEEATRSAMKTTAFPSLESIYLKKMPNLEEWLEPLPTSFPRLETLYIENCPKLRITPSSFPSLKILDFSPKTSGIAVRSLSANLSTLTFLYIDGCSDLTCLPEELLQRNKLLHTLKIKNCPLFEGFISKNDNNSDTGAESTGESSTCNVRTLDVSLNALEVMDIIGCPSFSRIPDTVPSLKALAIISSNGMLAELLTTKLSSLTYLWVEDLQGLAALPRDLLSRNKHLDCLSIVNCPRLSGDFLPNDEGKGLQLPSLTRFVARGCHSLESINLLGFKSLEFLEIQNCKGLKSLPNGLQFLSHLEHARLGWVSKEMVHLPFPEVAEPYFVSLYKLELIGSPLFMRLPHQIQHLKGLKNLDIYGFDSVIALPEWLGNISSLAELSISNCKNLMHLPPKEAMRRLTLLKLLEIDNCPLLKQRCNNDESSEEWLKISDIPSIKIDGDFIQDLS